MQQVTPLLLLVLMLMQAVLVQAAAHMLASCWCLSVTVTQYWLLLADTLEAGYTTSMVTQMYTDDIQASVKAIFNILKKDYPTVLQTMFQHNSAVGDSSEGNTSVLGSIQRKLFLDAVNIELDRAVWGLHTIFDAVFKPFASKQQVPLATSLPALFILIVERP